MSLARDRKILILVHPGSLCGSARSMIGKYEADAARDLILHEVQTHSGGLIVIDGSLSDELSRAENDLIDLALMRNEAEGYVAMRLWGCDSGEPPYADWQSFGMARQDAVFDSQQDAISTVAHKFAGRNVIVTGAWASVDGSTGCVCSVVDALHEDPANGITAAVSSCALMEPDETSEIETAPEGWT